MATEEEADAATVGGVGAVTGEASVAPGSCGGVALSSDTGVLEGLRLLVTAESKGTNSFLTRGSFGRRSK